MFNSSYHWLKRSYRSTLEYTIVIMTNHSNYDSMIYNIVWYNNNMRKRTCSHLHILKGFILRNLRLFIILGNKNKK